MCAGVLAQDMLELNLSVKQSKKEHSLSLNVLFMQSPIDMQQDIMQYSDSALICCQLLEIILA